MENTIETIWKNGFLKETSLIVPAVNDLYNRKSTHVIERVKKMFRLNQVLILIMSVFLPVIHYFVDALWQGLAGSLLLLITAWYNNLLIRSIKTLDQGATSFDYLRSFDRWLKDVLLKSEKIARFSYPLYLLIAISTIWSAWTKQGMILKMQQQFPGSILTKNMPLTALSIAVVSILLMFFFSVKIYRWEVRLMYGKVLNKVAETIAEIEKLKKE
jgi:hypothetical protein